MSSTSRVFLIDTDLEAALVEAASNGTSVRVRGARELRLRAEEIFSGEEEYDSEAMREAIRNYAGSWSDVDGEKLKQDIYRAREEGTRAVD